MSAYSWFGYMIFNSYNEMLSDDGFAVFANLRLRDVRDDLDMMRMVEAANQ